ncbi:MAG: O-antigen ligase family protein [Bacteroidetes bacterium]|nr:O-antigen ligase family protein [Bacteroidota bacterium]
MKITFADLCRFSFLVALAGLISMLPFSKYVISMSEMVLAGSWILQRYDTACFGRLLKKQSIPGRIGLILPYALVFLFKGIVRGFRDLYRNKPALVFLSLYLLHVAGLIFTTDFDYALKDLRTKAPIFLIPLFLGTSKPISRNLFNAYIFLFLLALVIGTLMYSWKIYHLRYIDIRDVSRNVSHIILGLELALGLFIMAWFIFRRSFPAWSKVLFILVSAWFIFYIFKSRSFTGLAVFAIAAMILLPILVFRQKRPGLKVLLAVAMVLITLGMAFYMQRVVKDFYAVKPVDKTRLDSLTSRGNPYVHNRSSVMTENGNYLYLYCQFGELKDAWNLRSKIPFDSNGVNGEKITFTLIRFLTSKNLRKDAGGVNALSPEEILAIERGVPNYLFLDQFSMRSRIYELLWGYEMYKRTGDPTGYTLMQRIEFWKASFGIISTHWLTGVGTGDMNEAFQQQYVKMNSKLPPDQRWRSHNQFLSIFVGFGVFGFVWFLIALFYPAWRLRGFTDYFFLVFMIIATLSMLTEDTLESQMGVTFFTFFYCFFLFGRKEYDRI